jgi:hypothetical protein
MKNEYWKDPPIQYCSVAEIEQEVEILLYQAQNQNHCNIDGFNTGYTCLAEIAELVSKGEIKH